MEARLVSPWCNVLTTRPFDSVLLWIHFAMPSFCCVPNCNQKGYTSLSGEKVSFFNFPKAPLLRKQWIHAIRRDEGKGFVITERTKVCSLHFKSEDLRKSINGRIYVKEGGIPLKFDWSGPSPKKRRPRLNANRCLRRKNCSPKKPSRCSPLSQVQASRLTHVKLRI